MGRKRDAVTNSPNQQLSQPPYTYVRSVRTLSPEGILPDRRLSRRLRVRIAVSCVTPAGMVPVIALPLTNKYCRDRSALIVEGNDPETMLAVTLSDLCT